MTDIFSLTANLNPLEYETRLEQMFGTDWYNLELETIFIGLKNEGFVEISEYTANKIGALMCCLHNMDRILHDWVSFEITGWGIVAGYVNSYSLDPLNTAQLIAFLTFLQSKGANIPNDLSDDVKGYIQSSLKQDNVIAPPGILSWAAEGLYNKEIQDSIYFRMKTVAKDRRSMSLVEDYIYSKHDMQAVDNREYFILWQLYKSVKSEKYADSIYTNLESLLKREAKEKSTEESEPVWVE